MSYKKYIFPDMEIHRFREPTFYNYREKIVINDNGEKETIQVMASKYAVFNPEKLEPFNKWENSTTKKKKKQVFEYDINALEPSELKGLLHSIEKDNKENSLRAKRRAKSKVFDYIMANNDLQLFCTLTLDKEKIDRMNYNDVIKKFNSWADNRVRRNGLKYVAVPELHKDGAIHFHLLCNGYSFQIVDSGTYIPPEKINGNKKPRKLSTLKKYNVDISECQQVFNIPSWEFGFSSAIFIKGERLRVASYIAKYITKTLDKVGGRYYLHGGNLSLPICKYYNVPWDDISDVEGYTFGICGNDFIVIGEE
jgi:hypothetical protein